MDFGRTSWHLDIGLGGYWDTEAVALASIVSQLPDSIEKTSAINNLKARLGQLAAGVALARNHPHIQRKIRTIDPTLTLRWDFEHAMYAVDKYIYQYGFHQCLFFWSHTLGEGGAIWNALNEADMQRWPSAQAYVEHKRAEAEKIRKANAVRRDEMALAAVDSLTRAQCDEFVAVETALATGEKIVPRGRDAEILNAMYDHTKVIQAQGDAGIPGIASAINPGMRPGKYKRIRSTTRSGQ